MDDARQPIASSPPVHEPVLVRQVLALLNPQPGMVCLDCTVGLGGHAAHIVPRLAPGGRYIGLDVDPQNLATAKERLGRFPVDCRVVEGDSPHFEMTKSGTENLGAGPAIKPVTPGVDAAGVAVDLVQANFASAMGVLDRLGVDGVDLLLADLGFASSQMGDSARGLSFGVQGPLDMRLDPRLVQTAADLVNELPEKDLADLIYRYGEERRSRKIAQKIVERRRESPIKTTLDLAQLVRRAYGPVGRKGRAGGGHRIDPATRTFMALRIAVNGEIAALEKLLNDLPRLLRKGAVAAVISFHSLEDRPVKHAFIGMGQQRAEKLTRKPLIADQQEQRENPRSRSAKLRAIRWIDSHADAQAQAAVDC